jgi:hypothetical protein
MDHLATVLGDLSSTQPPAVVPVDWAPVHLDA